MGEYIKVIDAHTHLWLWQDTVVDGKPIRQLPNGRSMFLGEEVQMMPPFMTSNLNSVETLLSNMDYARVSAAVVTQEFIDGMQNDYLEYVARRYPSRFRVFGMCEYRRPGFLIDAQYLIRRGFKGIKIPAARLIDSSGRISLTSDEMMQLFHLMENEGMMLAIELAENGLQCAEMEEIIAECPRLKVLIGHFGMANRPGWIDQIRLARHENVYIESGGITWLYNDEYYPFPSAVRAIKAAADEVGIDKLLWGSDYPRTITAITYRQSFDFILKTPEMSWEDKEKFLSSNAKKLFAFDDLISLPYIKNMSE